MCGQYPVCGKKSSCHSFTITTCYHFTFLFSWTNCWLLLSWSHRHTFSHHLPVLLYPNLDYFFKSWFFLLSSCPLTKSHNGSICFSFYQSLISVSPLLTLSASFVCCFECCLFHGIRVSLTSSKSQFNTEVLYGFSSFTNDAIWLWITIVLAR